MEDIDTFDASGLLVPDVTEDSVDIYDGLDINSSSNAEKSSSNGSLLKESMDLYEEIFTEEQQSRELAYSELKSRFQAAQNQIKELRRRLEQMEIQNTGLNTENCRLKKNISALLRTARQEVTRKDAEIQRLNQLSEKGLHHHHQSHINNVRDQNLSRRTATGSSKSRPSPLPSGPPPPPSCPPRPLLSSGPLPPSGPPLPSSLPPPLPPLPATHPREDRTPREPPQPSVKESNSSTYQLSGSCVETRASRASSHNHSKSSSSCDVTDKQTEHSISKSSSCSSTRHSESHKHKSKHREEKCQSESTDRRHRTGSDPNKVCNGPEKNRSHKEDRDKGRRYDSRSSKSRNYPNDEGHHRSERAKSPPPEILLSAAISDDKKGRSREQRPDKAKVSTSDSEHHAAHSSKEGYSRDHRKITTSDGHIRRSNSKDSKKSSSSKHSECYSDSSKEREGDKLSKDYQRKENRRREDEISGKHERSSLSKTSREREKQRSKESNQGRGDTCSKERKDKTQDALKISSEEPNITEKISVEENSPNRKLCFMETLNLTLSPMKKPVLPTNANHGDLTPMNKVVENGTDDESSQPNVEDMCVIDEVNSSELEAGLEDVAEQSPDITKSPDSEKTHKRSDDAKDVQEKDKNQSETPADHSVQTTLDHNQPLKTAENQMTVYLTPKSPESSSRKATDEKLTLSKNEDKTKLASNSWVDECRPLEATDGVSDTSASIYELHTSNSLQKVNSGNSTDQSVAVPAFVVLDSSVELKLKASKTAVKKSLPVDPVKEDTAASPSRESPVFDVSGKANPESHLFSPTILPQDCKQGLCPPASSSIHKKDACHTQDGSADADAVSSTISLESLPQEGLSLPEAIYILTQTNEDASDSSSFTTEPSSSTGCIAVSKVSSTTEETAVPEKRSDLTFTPKKSFSPGKSHEPSSSMPLLHDEDSMMRTLSNLKIIPDAISPLRSPIRITKRSHLHVHGKPGHVKSLQKEFSSTTVDANSKKLDVNKENKYPGSPANHEAQNLVDKVSDPASSLSDPELEEGEIISESDETAASSPIPATKRAKLERPVRNKPSPKTVLNRTSEERCVEENETAGVSTRSPKSRFKTVCPAASKASFSTIEEVMETFKLVRTEIRKKYMKLHKTFPRKSFYGVMDNFQESFLEFVDGANFGQICSQEGELRPKLKKLIVSVFDKVSNNGIVKRIFEQQAVDLKQKLWDFVDVQVEYLFRDVYTTLQSLCKPTRAQAEDNRPSGNNKVSRHPSAKKPQCQQKEAQSALTSLRRIKPCAVVPYKTGLGSRGKDIRITHVEKDRNVVPHQKNCPNTQTVVDFLPPKNIPPTPEKNSISSLVVSQNGSLLDRTDFELLTEQQASSLTFNLVRDSQMGEIFKCLLQGSDLLENNGIAGDNTAWSLGTPRKDGERLISITTPTKFDSPSKLLSPSKFETPSKLVATWSSISPRKMSSPRSKDQIPLNPAFFDESCLLEVPSENRAMLQSGLALQRSYSILAEDLAVSLTIPSPLKSDSHLSFLQPSSMHIMSTPDSVISAHISEDALLDGEDATEQDIHLALDTDNSSCDSSSSVASEVLATPFVFKPDLLMQALVMEKSNDHFIVKIRQAATDADTTLTADDSLSKTLTEGDQQHGEGGVASQESQAKAVLSDKSQKSTASNSVPSKNNQSNLAERSGICQAATSADTHLTQDESLTLTKDPPHKKDESTQQNTSKSCFSDDSRSESPQNLPQTTLSNNSLHCDSQNSDQSFGQISQATIREGITATAEVSASQTRHREIDMTSQQSPSEAILSDSDNSPHLSAEGSRTKRRQVLLTRVRDEIKVSKSERSLTIAKGEEKSHHCSTSEKDKRDCGRGRKRKNHQEKSKAKRPRKEEEEIAEEVIVSNYKRDDSESKSSPASLSPNSLYAKNVIRKKGEVVISWTRDEDRAILVELKTKGASRETFSALSEKLDKPSGQIAHRFYQLMKIFKKQEKMDT
ncbi:CASP8-associated protein 2 [Dicentrarchus labrax]|uniref:CASP8-associated protein 2 n=1 Tax=Dicentrarchus labrax TaxID=13489 RepID=UPI0021F65DE9|nr:CASP8-associated protein 2 [Dicentrarchus labrax]XP_051265828.1 CASP8-associated protein 2 [Dicentrarchus labrax]